MFDLNIDGVMEVVKPETYRKWLRMSFPMDWPSLRRSFAAAFETLVNGFRGPP